MKLCIALLAATGCVALQAQDVNSGKNAATSQFDINRLKLVPEPGAAKAAVPADNPAPVNKPCAAARVVRPGIFDQQIIHPNAPADPKPASRDITELKVPAPSCADVAKAPAIPAPPPKAK